MGGQAPFLNQPKKKKKKKKGGKIIISIFIIFFLGVFVWFAQAWLDGN
jgi:uncharacterized protein with PQ loop repeat